MLQIFPSATEVYAAAASYFIDLAKQAILDKGTFSVALSGGNSPKALYELLSSRYQNAIEWKHVSFFFGDERYVPADHPESNALMAKKSLFGPLGIETSQIFKVNTDLAPAKAAAQYEAVIQRHFTSATPVFDLILLGLGNDAHTASIFPGTAVVGDDKIGVRDVYVQSKQVHRITFTAPLINSAQNVAFLVLGADKAEAVDYVLNGEKNPVQYPAQLIKPVPGKLTWFLDEPAASGLKGTR